MSSDPDLNAAFAALRERAPEPRFASAAEVRRRGRRRTHRRIGVASAAVVVLLAGAGALTAGPLADGRTQPATTVSTRPPTSPAVERDVPNEFLLQPGDVPTGFEVGDDRDHDAYPQGLPAHYACAALGLTFSAEGHRRAGRQIVFAGIDAIRQSLSISEQQIHQQVTLYDPGWAARELADYRAWIDACPTPAGMVYEVLATGLSGDESVLYRVQTTSDQRFYLAIVRVGDRLTYLQVGSAFREATVRDLAVKAGERLGS